MSTGRVALVKSYAVAAQREGRYWVLHIEGVGTTQARTLREAPEMARSLISIMRRVPEDAVSVEVSPQLPAKYQREVDQARAAVLKLSEQQTETAKRSRHAAKALVESLGLSGRDAAAVLGVSPQRVSQLLAD